MALTETRKGEGYLFSEVLLWALFPVVTTFSLLYVPVFTAFAWSTLFSALFFGTVLIIRKSWVEMRQHILWTYVTWAALFIGVLYYGLYFMGLGLTTPGNAALIALFEIFTSYVFFHLWRKDSILLEHVVGAISMVVGAACILLPSFSQINIGDFLVLAATFFAPIGNYFQQRAREIASSETIMFMRTLLATPFIFALAYVWDGFAQTSFLDAVPFLLVNGLLLLGLSKILWIEAIHRISVTKANALSCAGPLLTLLFAWVFLGQNPTVWQLVSVVPFAAGVLLLTNVVQFSRIPHTT